MGQKSKNAGKKKNAPPKKRVVLTKHIIDVEQSPNALNALRELLWASPAKRCGYRLRESEYKNKLVSYINQCDVTKFTSVKT